MSKRSTKSSARATAKANAKKERAPKKDVAATTSPAPKPPRTAKEPRERDPRLPAVGQTITKEFKGKTLAVKCLADGFEFAGKHYTSLSAVAKDAFHQKSVNGFLAFGLIPRAAKPDATPKGRKGAKAPTEKIGDGNDIGTAAGQRAALAATGVAKRKKAEKPATDATPESTKEGK